MDGHTVAIFLKKDYQSTRNKGPGTESEEIVSKFSTASYSSEEEDSTVDEDEEELGIVMQSGLVEKKRSEDAENEFMEVMEENVSNLKEYDKWNNSRVNSRK